jgi:hypothetical protein
LGLPKAGAKTLPLWGLPWVLAWALVEDVKARRNMEAVKELKSILITNVWKYVGWQQGQREIDC